MEYVPARLLVFWAVHIVFLYDDRSQLGNWVLCLLVMLCFTILQPAFFALLGFCTAVKEQSNRFVEHPHPGPEPTLIALSIGDVVEQVREAGPFTCCSERPCTSVGNMHGFALADV